MNPTSQQPLSIPNLFKPPIAVIYSKDFEPICNIPMNEELYSYFTSYDIVRFPVQIPIDLKNPDKHVTQPPMYAEISAMRIISPDGVRLLLIARDDDLALLMRNTFLPGQTKELNFIKTQAFYKGMLKAIKEIKDK